jgi:hypothetical protein
MLSPFLAAFIKMMVPDCPDTQKAVDTAMDQTRVVIEDARPGADCRKAEDADRRTHARRLSDLTTMQQRSDPTNSR